MKKYYGKEKCRILKQIRAEIAKQNDIEWVVSECKHQGNCRGTCPKCEYEVRQLEAALARREALGKTVAVVGISAGIALSVSGCANPYGTSAGNATMDTVNQPAGSGNRPAVTDAATDVIAGGMILESTTEVSKGEYLPESETEEVLMGDPVLLPESETEPEPTAGVPMPPEFESETVEPLEGEEIPLPGEEPDPEWETDMGEMLLPEETETDFDEPLGGEPMPDPVTEDHLGDIGEWSTEEP